MFVIKDKDKKINLINKSGYKLLDHFELCEDIWWKERMWLHITLECA